MNRIYYLIPIFPFLIVFGHKKQKTKICLGFYIYFYTMLISSGFSLEWWQKGIAKIFIVPWPEEDYKIHQLKMIETTMMKILVSIIIFVLFFLVWKRRLMSSLLRMNNLSLFESIIDQCLNFKPSKTKSVLWLL